MLINWVWCTTRLRLNYTFSTSGGRKKNNNRNIVRVFIFNCSRNREARLQKIMKSPSSSLTSPVVSLVTLPETQLRRSQGNRNSLNPEQDLGPWRSHSAAMFTACWKRSFSCLICICQRYCSKGREPGWTLNCCPLGRSGFIRIRAVEVSHNSCLMMNSRQFRKQKIKFEPPFYNFHSTCPKHFSCCKNYGVTYNPCSCLLE